MPRSSQGQPEKGNNTYVNPPTSESVGGGEAAILSAKDIPGKLRIARSTRLPQITSP